MFKKFLNWRLCGLIYRHNLLSEPVILKVTDILKQVFVYIVTNIIIDLDNFIVAEILVLYESTIVL